MTEQTHISIRITDQRRANIDALARIAHTDGDTATLDFALSFTLAHLKGDTMSVTEQRARNRVSHNPDLRQYEPN